MVKLILDKTKRYYGKYGILRLIKKIILNICPLLFYSKLFNFYSISGTPPRQVQARCPLHIRRGSADDLVWVENILIEIDEVAVRYRVKHLLDNGGQMFLGLSKGEPVHIAWLFYYPGISETPLHVELEPDEAYISSCHTHPEFRGNNIYPVVLQHILRHAAKENRKRCFISSNAANSASIRGIEKAGFSFVGRIRVFRLFGKAFNNRWMSSKIVNLDQEE